MFRNIKQNRMKPNRIQSKSAECTFEFQKANKNKTKQNKTKNKTKDGRLCGPDFETQRARRDGRVEMGK